MSLLDEQVVYLPLGLIDPDPNNLNEHNERNIDHIIASITNFGFLDPIGVVVHPDDTSRYMVVEGGGRLEAAIALSYPEVPCIILELDDSERRAYAIAHNHIQRLTNMKPDIVAAEFSRLNVTMDDYSMLGYSDEDVLFLPKLHDGDFQQEQEPDATTKTAPIVGFIPPVYKTTLVFASDHGYNRFTSLLSHIRTKYPLAGTVGERLRLLVEEINGIGSGACQIQE